MITNKLKKYVQLGLLQIVLILSLSLHSTNVKGQVFSNYFNPDAFRYLEIQGEAGLGYSFGLLGTMFVQGSNMFIGSTIDYYVAEKNALRLRLSLSQSTGAYSATREIKNAETKALIRTEETNANFNMNSSCIGISWFRHNYHRHKGLGVSIGIDFILNLNGTLNYKTNIGEYEGKTSSQEYNFSFFDYQNNTNKATWMNRFNMAFNLGVFYKFNEFFNAGVNMRMGLLNYSNEFGNVLLNNQVNIVTQMMLFKK